MYETKLVYGIGISDKGDHIAWIDGKDTKEYKVWCSMLQRCQPDGLYQKKLPSYIGCTVHPDFIRFQAFAEWCQHQIGFGLDGWSLDKDILDPTNKVYGPDTCVFVPQVLNTLVTHKRSNQGDCPTGVYFNKKNQKYHAQVRVDGKLKHLGYYTTPDAAEQAYKVGKLADIYRQAAIWQDRIDHRVYRALMTYQL